MRKYIILTTILSLILTQISFVLAKDPELTEIDNDKYVEIATKQSEKDNITLYKSNLGRFAAIQSQKDKDCHAHHKDKHHHADCHIEINGFFLITSDFSTSKGYQGPTAVGLEIDKEGKIVSADIIESLETRTYVRKIEQKGFMKKFIGLNSDKVEVHAVSGATMTCDAIEQSISETLKAFQTLKDYFVINDGVITTSDTTYTIEKIK